MLPAKKPKTNTITTNILLIPKLSFFSCEMSNVHSNKIGYYRVKAAKTLLKKQMFLSSISMPMLMILKMLRWFCPHNKCVNV